MFVVGLTGGIGSGKSFVSNLFSGFGINIIDSDIIAREVVAPETNALKKITTKFGKHVLFKNGELNRNKLREIIFSSPEQKVWLENLLHPIIREETLTQIESAKSLYAILVAPLLIEKNMQPLINRLLVIDIPQELQIERVLKRDQSSKATIDAIVSSQISREERLKFANDVIDNSISKASTEARVKELHEKYSSLAKDTIYS